MISMLKRIAARLPFRWQQSLKRMRFARQIRRGTFASREAEYALLDGMISEGDWVLDIGANVGHYTARMSELAGPNGRVIAFEPVPDTMELLAANVAVLPTRNVSLVNAAASDRPALAGMSIPCFETGLDNFYMAHLTEGGTDVGVLCLRVDTLQLPGTISLVKIDAEGHERAVLGGMEETLRRDLPTLIIEGDSAEVEQFLAGIGYAFETLPGSPNRIYRQPKGVEGERG